MPQATKPAQLPAWLHRYNFESTHFDLSHLAPISIIAKTEEQAWDKFVEQRSGALKPSRSDWTITDSGSNQ